MTTKICFKCNVEKLIEEFYKHSQMSDGHLNKCKECTKKDVSGKYFENIENSEYVEKERLRGRIKYAKYKYKRNPENAHLDVNKATSKFLFKKGIDLQNKEVHHWKYDEIHKNNVFVINPRCHAMIHKNITYDKNLKCFITKEGSPLTTKELHYKFIMDLCAKNNSNYEIESYEF